MSIVIQKYNKEVLTGEDIHIVLSSRGGRNTVWERIDEENGVYVEVGTWKDNGRIRPLRKRFKNYKNLNYKS